MRALVRLAALGLVLALSVTPAAAHDERGTVFPEGDLDLPSYRFDGPTLVVCKPDTPARLAVLPQALRVRNQALLDDCAYEHIQAAVDAVTQPGTRILVLPGLYREEPYVGLAPEGCEDFVPETAGDTGDNGRGTPVLTYEEQRSCPHVQNLIAVFGDTDDDGRCEGALCDLQIEGTGGRPQDVVVDGQFKTLNGIRGDRADGLYLRNLTVQRFEFNAVYVLETDGFVFDEVLTRWNDEYGFLTFAVDHGLYQNCESHTNGDSGVYPGSASDLNADGGLIGEDPDLRFGTEIRGCRSHHSTLGYSGTAGNSVLTHHNEFDHNITGTATDSLFPDHPGLPQDHGWMHSNVIHSNNATYYDYVQGGDCVGPFSDRDYDEGVVCPVVPLPIGTGMVIAGGNHNLYERNLIYDNHRMGIMQFFVPATLRGEDDPAKQFDTSNFNTHRDNLLASNPLGPVQPNGVDFWWDGEGEGNCWDANTSAAGDPTFSIGDLPAPGLPGCDSRPPFTPASMIVTDAGCAEYSRDDNPSPPGCDWFGHPDVPAAREPEAPTVERVAGADRITTAIAASREAFPGSAEAVVLARADAFPDALAGAPLAEAVGGPILLTGSGALDPATAAEITRLGAGRVLLLGGTSALSDAVAGDVAALGVADMVRVSGPDRYATAVAIARLLGGAHAYLAKGSDYPDALGAAAIAAHQQRPVLLTASGALPQVVADFLAEGRISDVRIVGGTAAVTEAVESALPDSVVDVDRLAGGNRFETSLRLAEAAVVAGADPTELWLATGANWPDALAAGPAAAVDEGVLMLTDPNELAAESPADQWLQANAVMLENIRILGGPAAVSAGVEDALTGSYGAAAGDARGDRSHGTLVTSGALTPFDGVDGAYAGVAGTARMVRTAHGTTEVEILVEGLPAGEAFGVHVHTRSCADGQGGDHFRFDPAGSDMPPNEIHAPFRTDTAGVGRGTATAFALAGPQARSVVTHHADGTKLACADLTGAEIPPSEDLPDAAGIPAGGTTGALGWLALAAIVVLAGSVAARRRSLRLLALSAR